MICEFEGRSPEEKPAMNVANRYMNGNIYSPLKKTEDIFQPAGEPAESSGNTAA